MKNLRLSIAALLVALTLFFNIERLDLAQPDLIDIHTFIYVYGFGVALVVLLVPQLWKRPSPLIQLLTIVVYAVLRMFVWNRDPLLGGVYTYITVTEIAFLSLLVWLSHRVARHLHDFEEAVANITFGDTYRRVQRLDEAMEMIQLELTRSRRYKNPLSLLVITPESDSMPAMLHRTVEEVQRAMMGRYVHASMARAISMVLRRTDLVVEQQEQKRFIILSPETSAEATEIVSDRIRTIVAEQLGIPISCGYASFPADALTFEELLRQAESRLNLPVEELDTQISFGRRATDDEEPLT